MPKKYNLSRPQNESETHFKLKEISKYILFAWGYTKVASEVSGMWSFDFKKSHKGIIDAVGVKTVKKGHNVYFDVKGIEAKASLSDFRNGYCTAPAYTYIIAPLGVIPVSLIPKDIGFIEVDLDNFKVSTKYIKTLSDLQGVSLTKRASKRIDKRFGNEIIYRDWCAQVLERVAYRNSMELLFWRNYLDLKS